MNARPKAVAGYVLGWCLIACFVVLLTLIFSFLGTLICAALTGMMMGAARLKKWQSLAMSLLFPAVITTVLRMSRAELTAKEICFLSLLCFGLFWLIYVAVFALVSQEQAARPEQPRPRATAPSTSAGPDANQISEVGDQRSDAMAAMAKVETPLPELNLADLQGKWLSQAPRPEPRGQQKLIEIDHQTLILSLLSEDGHADLLGKAELKLSHHSVLLLPTASKVAASN
ncbi:MAG: hypothetical protein EHM35_16085 [Planctomycetaceae bacterium]|nr:MAG: hypothetical protein EHM35_16085 [Planctomycetaceae bacterium]